MLIPSIDLMGGRIVQLVQGEKKALEFDDFDPWIERFKKCPLVQLIDLDAAIGTGSNRALLERFTRRLTCQVGGGIRDVATARRILELGVRAVIIGSALVKDGAVNTGFAEQLAREASADRLVFAVDSKRGHVATHGWRRATELTAEEMMRELDPWCSAFLYTHVDTEGLMEGIPLDMIKKLRLATKKKLMAAGGINSLDQVSELDRMGVDAVVGMAIYTGRIDV
ncbi:MAG: 1-(5-phosphoribosyl)-5-[(5-phosphoribosylamino)methylideneamino] imidazole-4-carboxamide isomerase [Acidobacteriia bacterium]|nr:1-(5-phosphoribosyl)-5-[(5-phosphoribosylamino)methylideneamino] imidazole-4-carboxamide isomerase [Terriglobia bacterium]